MNSILVLHSDLLSILQFEPWTGLSIWMSLYGRVVWVGKRRFGVPFLCARKWWWWKQEQQALPASFPWKNMSLGKHKKVQPGAVPCSWTSPLTLANH